MNYVVLPNPETLASHAADIIEGAIAANGGIVLGLAGGSTPKATYRTLARRDIDWTHTTTWMTDERWVMPDHDDANQNMVMESLVEPTGVKFLVPDTAIESSADAAAAFSDRVVAAVRGAKRSIVLLGIGADGHTASLFPGTSALDVRDAGYVDNYVPQLGVPRLTATFGLLAETDLIIFLVAGKEKASMIASISAGASVPAARVTAQEQVLWLLDEAAASALQEERSTRERPPTKAGS